MFRKPREQASVDVRRPPTPPTSTTGFSSPRPRLSPMATVTTPRMLKGLGERSEKGVRTGAKTKQNGNGSILNFFKKAQSTTVVGEDDLFITDDDTPNPLGSWKRQESPKEEVVNRPMQAKQLDLGDSRYNENGGAMKRRRVGNTSSRDPENLAPPFEQQDSGGAFLVSADIKTETPASTNSGLEALRLNTKSSTETDIKAEPVCESSSLAAAGTVDPGANTTPYGKPIPVPSLRRAGTSTEVDLFDGMEDFAEEEFPDTGEEYMERLYMEEQRLLEEDLGYDEEFGSASELLACPEKPALTAEQGDAIAECPLCSENLSGFDPEKASIHVNNCLDGNHSLATPPSHEEEKVKKERIDQAGINSKELSIGPSHKRFQRAAIARPGQENPFQLGGSTKSGSAFSKLMSSHAEDAAWATAAANEVSSRGKPAFKRTCPFYKILPGFFICVDAFRYGAVEGCKAYFLSHFHSDHYIGLTSSWSHGPIYCSHVTANLIRQQLRVNPRWLVDLDFEKTQEVPGTQGVSVTMIPANHCPGSSLFLFEKTVGRGNNPKKQRILHCGDFRACPAHVKHPLLRPDVIDVARGQGREQKLDVCYLDTTYLTPKYAFPSQEDVIKACADMCISLSKDRVDKEDDWEQTKKQRAGSGMVKFVRNQSTGATDGSAEGPGDACNGAAKDGKGRGRLLVVVGTYSIGKERICLGVARALNSKIFAPPNKLKICAALEDPELSSRLTGDPLEAQVHMQMLMEIRAETLADYLTGYKPHFSRIVGFRPSGWNYRPPNSRFVESPLVQTVLYSENWKSKYSMAELVPQRGSTRDASCFGVPYSEHSSFRELTMFCCALRIDKIIPTVNVGSAKSREKMKGWIEKWAAEKKKNGLFKVADDLPAWNQ